MPNFGEMPVGLPENENNETNETFEELGSKFDAAMQKLSDKEFEMVADATARMKDPEALKRYRSANTDILSPEAKSAIDLSIRIKELAE